MFLACPGLTCLPSQASLIVKVSLCHVLTTVLKLTGWARWGRSGWRGSGKSLLSFCRISKCCVLVHSPTICRGFPLALFVSCYCCSSAPCSLCFMALCSSALPFTVHMFFFFFHIWHSLWNYDDFCYFIGTILRNQHQFKDLYLSQVKILFYWWCLKFRTVDGASLVFLISLI